MSRVAGVWTRITHDEGLDTDNCGQKSSTEETRSELQRSCMEHVVDNCSHRVDFDGV